MPDTILKLNANQLVDNRNVYRLVIRETNDREMCEGMNSFW